MRTLAANSAVARGGFVASSSCRGLERISGAGEPHVEGQRQLTLRLGDDRESLLRKGRTNFTDPRHGDQGGRELDVEGAYRLDTRGQARWILSQPEIQKPNGIVVARDDRQLYLVDSNPLSGSNRKIWAFDLDADGTPSHQRLVYDFGPGRVGDGMRIDREGNLWIAAGINIHRGRSGETADVPAGMYVVSPACMLHERIPIPEETATNVTCGPPDKKMLS